MTQVTVSPKFQIVIPRDIRKRLGLRPGQRVTLIERAGVITAVPDLRATKFRGILKGMSRRAIREKKERL